VCCFLFAITIAVLGPSCNSSEETPPPSPRLKDLPNVIVWAWERPEDLRFLDSEKYGAAFLAQTLVLSNGDVAIKPRRQPLEVAPAMKLIAVTRIESQKVTGEPAMMNESSKEKIVKAILRTLELKNVSGVQIDFDVVVSEREFYRALLTALRSQLPDHVPLSITALTSFCLGDRWMKGLPVDEIVPMIFRMGDDDLRIKTRLENGGDFREPLCRRSYGISLDEPLQMKFDYTRRIYVFNPESWNASDTARLEMILKQ
jgi:hypothetical protein